MKKYKTEESLLEHIERTNLSLLAHSKGVISLAEDFGSFLGLSPLALEKLKKGATLHDVGKIHLEMQILEKPGTLTKSEYDKVKVHPFEGFILLKDAGVVDRDVLEMVIQHHECVDGSGYPFGLNGQSINQLSKILSLCDVFDALVKERCYKSAMSALDAINMMEKNFGKQFDMVLGNQFKLFVQKKENLAQVSIL